MEFFHGVFISYRYFIETSVTIYENFMFHWDILSVFMAIKFTSENHSPIFEIKVQLKGFAVILSNI